VISATTGKGTIHYLRKRAKRNCTFNVYYKLLDRPSDPTATGIIDAAKRHASLGLCSLEHPKSRWRDLSNPI